MDGRMNDSNFFPTFVEKKKREEGKKEQKKKEFNANRWFYHSAFRDVDGTYYVVYKVDGNSIGHGGICNNGIAPIVPTPLQILALEPDAITPKGTAAITILENGAADGPLIEAPSLIHVDGTYVLFFSSNCYSTTNYDTSYATSTSLLGGYTKSGSPLLTTGNDGLYGPGGATASEDGSVIVYHAFCGEDLASGRCMHERALSVVGSQVNTALIWLRMIWVRLAGVGVGWKG